MAMWLAFACLATVAVAVQAIPLQNLHAPMFPYGTSDFRDIVDCRQFFVDKTSYIPLLESAGKYNCIWRPRRFGKSLLCSMLANYYDKAVPEDEACEFVTISFRC